MAKAKTKGKKKFKSRQKKNIPVGVVHVQATFNNTIVTILRCRREDRFVVERRLAGVPRIAERHSVCAQQAGMTAVNAAKEHGLRKVSVCIKGPRRRTRGGNPRADGRGRSGYPYPRRHADAA